MTSTEIRQQFLDFFKSKDHRIVPSSPVVPFDDPTLLFTNAGMNQFKDVFLGKGTREYKRAADTQKCIRVSGKHNDLEEVGHDTYHHTFFEMLGNWSFGDYYKAEAIEWAWEILTDVWKLPKERIWATVYRTDDEAFELWKKKTDINPNHILRFDEKDNFWEMGETGPCGPCSEIHINLSDDYDNPKYVNAGVPECIEIWNLVFIQYNRDENGKLHDLPAKHVDTGMGFERVCAVLQKKSSNYDTDVFMPLINEISKISNIAYEKEEDKIAMRVIADHIRTLSFAIADGAVPGNDGRGYVLRRILRRAARYGRKLNLNKPFLYKLVYTLVKNMGNVFPKLVEKQKYVEKVIMAEEESFNVTLDRGIAIFNEYAFLAIYQSFKKEDYSVSLDFDNSIGEQFIDLGKETEVSKKIREDHLNKTGDFAYSINKMDFVDIGRIYPSTVNEKIISAFLKTKPILSGEVIFKLYDTFGFPVDLTNVMAKEIGIIIDEDGFNRLMDEQKKRSRRVTKKKINDLNIFVHDSISVTDNIKLENKTIFTGYDKLKTKTKIVGVKEDGVNLIVVLEQSPFYVESGGQVNDIGKLKTPFNRQIFEVVDVQKENEIIFHFLEINDKTWKLESNITIIAEVDEKRRLDIMRNHTATHFLHAALRKILGTHVHQAGSYVGPDRLRFDFTHFSKLGENEIRDIESLVNEELRKNIELQHHRNIPFDTAKKMGALMFFGDKYGDKVNVVQFGDYSMEFCGGTHVKNSSQIGLFKIVSESSIASGVRRIEAVTGLGVEQYISAQLNLLKNSEERIVELTDSRKKLEKEISELKMAGKLNQVDPVLAKFSEVDSIKVYKGKINAETMDELKSFGDELRNRIKSGVGVLFAEPEGKAGIVCVVSDDLIKEKKLSAGKIVGELAKLVGGGGGGRPHLATAGGKDVEKISLALSNVEEIVKKFL